MDINLRLPSGEHDKEDKDDEAREMTIFMDDDKLNNEDDLGRDIEKIPSDSDGTMISTSLDLVDFKEDINLEPISGMEFESHGEAYSFYQEYARSMGFSTAIQNSRRSKTSREFIDAKFACSRYGTKREQDKSFNRPRSRQGNNQDPENASGRRSCSKTDCKASMHVKRRSDGKWIIHRFEKDHNHDLLPAQAVSEQTRKMYAAMARQFAEYKNVVGLRIEASNPFDKLRNMALESGEANTLCRFFAQMQSLNSNFFYAIDVGEDQRVKTLLWVDAKSRHDYVNFCDVVSFDTTYVRNKYRMPLALFIGVNQHYQFMLLGCALLSDETTATYHWVMQTWLTAVSGLAPKVVITDKDPFLESAVSLALPSSKHCFFLWNIMGKISEVLNQVIKQNDNFMAKFDKCIYRSWTDEQFDKRWFKMVDRVGLKDSEWMQSLYDSRKQWVPIYMKDVFLAGMSTFQRSESVNCFFDKYVHRKTTVQEFVRQYENIIHDRYEEEAKGDSDTWNRPPILKSPSPFEKHVSSIYTHAVFRKFQAEVLGAVACMPKKEAHEDMTLSYRVSEFEKNMDFNVYYNESTMEVSCTCRLFEFKGYLCRHVLIVLQICGLATIPSQYVLKRWSKDVKNRGIVEGPEVVPYRVQRYNDLCQRAIKLGEEGSLSQESYNLAVRELENVYASCLCINNSNKNLTEAGPSTTPRIEEDNQSRNMRTNKKKNPMKKRKVSLEQDIMTVGAQDSLQQLDKLNSRSVGMDGYFGPPQSMQGMVQLNLMAPSRDYNFGNQQTIQGLGQLNSIAPNHESYYSTPAAPSLLNSCLQDFYRAPSGFTYGIREEPGIRTTQLHDDGSRHP